VTLYFRLLAILLRSWFSARIKLTDGAQLRGRVWPLDLDLNLHMTNARYLALADLGRVDLILRSGAWRAMRRGRLGMVLGGTSIRFRRPLRPFERFTLSTTVLGWDGRWVYLRQIFNGEHGPACIGVMRTAFTRHGALVPPQKFIDLSAEPGWVLQPPAWVKAWSELETEFVPQTHAAH